MNIRRAQYTKHLLINLSFHPTIFSIYYYVPGTILGAQSPSVTKTKLSAISELTF